MAYKESSELILIYMAVGLYDSHRFEWRFLLVFHCTKIVKQFLFLAQSIVFIHTGMFLNFLNNNAFMSF